MNGKENKKALVISTNKFWMGISRLPSALHRAGFISYALCPHGSYLSYTRFLNGIVQFPSFTYTRSKLFYLPLIYALLKYRPDIVIAGDEEALVALQNVANAFEKIPVLMNISKTLRKSLAKKDYDKLLLSKSILMEKCQQWNVRVPKNCVIGSLEDAKIKARQLGFPLVLKVDGGYGGAGVYICHNEEELIKNFMASGNLSFFQKLKMALKNLFFIPTTSGLLSISLQEFISGMTGHIPFCALEGKWLAGNSMLKLQTFPGATGPSSVSGGFDNAEVEHFAKTIVERLGYSGLGAFDFIVQEETQNIYFIELNPRATPACHFGEVLVSYDLCRTYFLALNGLPLENRPFKDFTVAMFPNEIKRDPKSSYLASAFHDIPSDDPLLLEALNRSI